ncbi:hypothetical protein [Bradyrhizobium elkanii]|uniref:hypothetical protein n=1 Tax=Bradyrhizobium elkanii TaxID=29448 RepID=UPI00159EF5D3|nr:hypothetical protein [Bradyrhizobium elkanii]MCP1967270.1 hypothetical protein [Bradyrhizobium elkanii]MCS3523440.1 hypothetical protein [Bradyrhizobium elkanii]MCS4071095.1 hypothetical protein [Bradyrhizobium elkanii]MCS4077726.1 hypothetical protein [Bradyrhizobium elkanii]MCS4111225.1 hypothetical protein [Bradyrhizobium elkanii]
MQKIAASFARHGAMPSALCCNISAFDEKICGSSNRHDFRGRFALTCSRLRRKDARLPD